MILTGEKSMKLNRIKLIISLFFVVPIIAVLMFSSKPLGTTVRADDVESAAAYKVKCAMCHSPKAEKLFDPAKTDEELVETLMKGKKGEKPPFMPGFEAKGMTADQAKALVTYMKGLRKPAS
jgi:mono/diheme cytochrome c family protein